MDAHDLLAQAHWALVNSNDRANVQLAHPAIEAIEDYLTLNGWRLGPGGRLVRKPGGVTGGLDEQTGMGYGVVGGGGDGC